jgi:hypothetical protein
MELNDIDLTKMESRNSCDCSQPPPAVINIPKELIKVPFNRIFNYHLPEVIDSEVKNSFID